MKAIPIATVATRRTNTHSLVFAFFLYFHFDSFRRLPPFDIESEYVLNAFGRECVRKCNISPYIFVFCLCSVWIFHSADVLRSAYEITHNGFGESLTSASFRFIYSRRISIWCDWFCVFTGASHAAANSLELLHPIQTFALIPRHGFEWTQLYTAQRLAVE